MAILSSSNLITLHALGILLPVAATYVVSPNAIPSSALVWSIGEALNLPDSSDTSGAPSGILAFTMLFLVVFQVLLAPPKPQSRSKYNVVTFSSAYTSTKAWLGLASILMGICLSLAASIYFLANQESKIALAVTDRTLLAACFVEFFVWYYIYSALQAEFGELNAVGQERGEEWGVIGNSKVRFD